MVSLTLCGTFTGGKNLWLSSLDRCLSDEPLKERMADVAEEIAEVEARLSQAD